MLHAKIGQQTLALSGFQVHNPEASARIVPRSFRARLVIQLLAIGRDVWTTGITLGGNLPVAARVVEPDCALARADRSDEGAAVGSEFDFLFFGDAGGDLLGRPIPDALARHTNPTAL